MDITYKTPDVVPRVTANPDDTGDVLPRENEIMEEASITVVDDTPD